MVKRAEYLDNRDLALRIMGRGFDEVHKKIGKRMTPVLASKIVELLCSEYNFKKTDLDVKLLDLAKKKRKAHTGGPVTPPDNGEVREYVVGGNGRIGVPLGILGKKPGDRARVKYTKKQIVICP